MLEPSLPVQLRLRPDSFQQTAKPLWNDTYAVRQLLANSQEHCPHDDILVQLARQKRLKAAVWVVKTLLQASSPSSTRLIKRDSDNSWAGAVLGRADSTRIQHGRKSRSSFLPNVASSSVESRNQLHAQLGVIWQSLGLMIIEDASTRSETSPELLEMIAFLHGANMMPDDVYTNEEAGPTQRTRFASPTLPLLSSHILNALSEVALRSHHNYKVPTPSHVSSRDLYEALSSTGPQPSFHLRVTPLRHEVWLELILWSCLRGGWSSYGLPVLLALVGRTGQHTWTTFDATLVEGRTVVGDLDVATLNIDKTISVELVAAFIEALLDMLSSTTHTIRMKSVESRESLAKQIVLLTRFANLAPSSPVAQALTRRVIATLNGSSVDVDREPYLAEALIDVLGSIHGGAQAAQISSLLDGLLLSYISTGNVVAATRIVDKVRAMCEATTRSEYISIHASTMALFVDSLAENRAFQFGATLFDSETDNLILVSAQEQRSNKHLLPSLIRFTSAARLDKALDVALAAARTLLDVRREDPPLPWLLAVLYSQISFDKWTAVGKTLSTMLRFTVGSTNVNVTMALCHIARAAMLQSQRLAVQPGDHRQSHRALDMWQGIVTDDSSQYNHRVLDSIAAVMALADDRWAAYYQQRRTIGKQWPFQLNLQAFHILLDCVTEAYGVQAGRRLLSQFWNLQSCARDNDTLRDRPYISWTTDDSGKPRIQVRGNMTINATTVRIVSLRGDRLSKDDMAQRWDFVALRALGVSDNDARDDIAGQTMVK